MSTLNYAAIDETYPVAGQDNNSQGFRGNFAAIKNAVAQAETDITALETNTAKKNASNDFNGNTVANATYNKFYGATYALGIISTPQDINLNNGPLQYVTFAADTTITFTNWPLTGKYALVRVHMISDGNAIRTPTLATSGGGSFAYETGYPNPLTLPINGKNKVIEAWTYNGGAKVFVKYIGEF
jgi:hypothetical protein